MEPPGCKDARKFYFSGVYRSGKLTTAREAFSPTIGLFEAADDGVLLRVRTDDLAWFARQLARVPFDFEIRTPQRLRRELAAHAARLQKFALDRLRPRTASAKIMSGRSRHRERQMD